MSRSGSDLSALPAGARVVIALPSGDQLADLLLQCLDRELVAVPLDPRLSARQRETTARRVRAGAVVTSDGVHHTGLPADHPDAEGLGLIMFTSGSTGVPKGVMLPRSAVYANARHTADLHGFRPDRPHATCLPLYHCNALVMSLIGTHLTGTPLVLHSRFHPVDYFADLRAKEVRTASVVPAMLPDLLDAAPPWPESLDYLITAAAPLTAELAHRFHQLYGPRLRQGYGLTELVNFSFTTPDFEPRRWTREYLRHHPPVGVALPGTELRLEAGEVWIRSADRMRGYWEDPESTRAALTEDGWLRTGDLGEVREGLLVLNGRRAERIDRGGEKYYPLDVERMWREAGMNGRFAAVPVPDDVLGDEIGLVAEDIRVLDVARRLVERGPLRPAALSFGDFAATATGKPQRSAMGRRLVAGRENPARWSTVEQLDTDAARASARRARAALAERVAERLGFPEGTTQLDLTDGAATSWLPGLAGADRPLLVLHGPAEGPLAGPAGTTRWELLAALGRAGTCGAALIRAGGIDLGGVVWAC